MAKPRKRIYSEYRARGEGLIIDEVKPATIWKSRDSFVEFDDTYEKNGSWVVGIESVFDAEWLKQQVDVQHEVARCMQFPFFGAMRCLADIADLVSAVRLAESGAPSLLNQLRAADEYIGACYEARVARMLVDAGLPYRIGSTKGDGNRFDIEVGGEQPFDIEVKSKRKPEWAAFEEAAASRVLSYLPVPEGWHCEFEWHPRLSRDFRLDRTPDLNRLADLAITRIRRAIADNPERRHLEVQLDGVGLATLRPADADVLSSVLSLPDETRDATRIAKAAFGKASTQLRENVPGIVVLCAEPDVADEGVTVAAVKAKFEEEGRDHPHIAGAIVFFKAHRLSCVLERTWPRTNPFSRTRMADLPLLAAKRPTENRRIPS